MIGATYVFSTCLLENGTQSSSSFWNFSIWLPTQGTCNIMGEWKTDGRIEVHHWYFAIHFTMFIREWKLPVWKVIAVGCGQYYPTLEIGKREIVKTDSCIKTEHWSLISGQHHCIKLKIQNYFNCLWGLPPLPEQCAPALPQQGCRGGKQAFASWIILIMLLMLATMTTLIMMNDEHLTEGEKFTVVQYRSLFFLAGRPARYLRPLMVGQSHFFRIWTFETWDPWDIWSKW